MLWKYCRAIWSIMPIKLLLNLNLKETGGEGVKEKMKRRPWLKRE